MNNTNLIAILLVLIFIVLVYHVSTRPSGPNPMFFVTDQSPYWYANAYWRPRQWGTKQHGTAHRFGLAGPPMPGPMR